MYYPYDLINYKLLGCDSTKIHGTEFPSAPICNSSNLELFLILFPVDFKNSYYMNIKKNKLNSRSKL